VKLVPRRRSLLVLAALALLGIALPAAADAARRKPVKLTVMTRNLYVGADIKKPILTSTFQDWTAANTHVFQSVQTTDFRARAKLLAKEVERTKPDLIGLQEVALWRRSPNGTVDGQQTPATIVVYDFLRLLRRALAAGGMRYRVGSIRREADVEGATDLGFDARLTNYDVVLVRRKKGLRVLRKDDDEYEAHIDVNTPGGEVHVDRGWASVDASYKGHRFRFVDTHLESALNDTRLKEAQELVARGGPTRTRLPVILVGDMNSDPNDAASADPAAYKTITGAGFRDAWITIEGRKNLGYACCFKREDIMDTPPAPFDHRIDHIFTKPRIRGTRAVIVGGDPSNRTSSGLWPSDHGGWVATLLLR
jgi:endonuclease/exonuclease/phosphatase family metal-dependent hydrolase